MGQLGLFYVHPSSSSSFSPPWVVYLVAWFQEQLNRQTDLFVVPCEHVEYQPGRHIKDHVLANEEKNESWFEI